MLTPQDLTSIKQLLGETEANLTSQIKTNTLKLEMVEKRLERVEIDLAVNTKGVVGVKKKVTKLEQETHFLRESLNATIDNFERGNIIDRRAGRTLTTKESHLLSQAINKIKMPFSFEFKSTIQHRGVLVIPGNFSDKITEYSVYRLKLGSNIDVALHKHEHQGYAWVTGKECYKRNDLMQGVHEILRRTGHID